MDYAQNEAAGTALLERVRTGYEARQMRLPGLHVSDLIFCRRKAWYRTHEYPAAPTTDQTNLQLLLGIAFGALVEELHTSEVPVIINTPATPVHGTIDILELDPDGTPTRVVEIKESRSGSKKPLDMLGYYVEQVASYCVGVGVNDARLHIAHLLGDYTGPKLPQFKTWDIHFSDRELGGWQNELAIRAEQVLAPSAPSSKMTHWGFECDSCAYAAFCPKGDGYKSGFFSGASEEVWPW